MAPPVGSSIFGEASLWNVITPGPAPLPPFEGSYYVFTTDFSDFHRISQPDFPDSDILTLDDPAPNMVNFRSNVYGEFVVIFYNSGGDGTVVEVFDQELGNKIESRALGNLDRASGAIASDLEGSVYFGTRQLTSGSGVVRVYKWSRDLGEELWVAEFDALDSGAGRVAKLEMTLGGKLLVSTESTTRTAETNAVHKVDATTGDIEVSRPLKSATDESSWQRIFATKADRYYAWYGRFFSDGGNERFVAELDKDTLEIINKQVISAGPQADVVDSEDNIIIGDAGGNLISFDADLSANWSENMASGAFIQYLACGADGRIYTAVEDFNPSPFVAQVNQDTGAVLETWRPASENELTPALITTLDKWAYWAFD